MYYENPDEEEAYTAKYQYYFGESTIVSPIAEPVHTNTELIGHKSWLPGGDWIDMAMGKRVQGGGWCRESYLLSETPVFIRPGAVLPGQFDAVRLSDGSAKNLMVTAFRGGKGENSLYTILITHDLDAEKGRIAGFKGLAARLKRICALNGMVVPIRRISENERIGVDVGQAYNRINIDPSRYADEMMRLRSLLPSLAGELGKLVAPLRERRAIDESGLAAKARDMARAIVKQFAIR